MRYSIKENVPRQWYSMAILLLVLTVLYLPVFSGLIRAWRIKEHCSHGFLVLPIVAYLVWSKRDRLGKLVPAPAIPGLIPILLGMVVYLIGSLGQVSTLSNVSLLLNVVGVVWVLAGTEAVRVLWFPICYLGFMFPIPDFLYISLTNPLKHLVTRLSVWAMGSFGIDVYNEGNILYLPNITLEVVEGCSGLRSFIVYVLLAVILAYFLPRGRWGRGIILLVSTIPLAIICNATRVILTGLLGSWYGNKMAEGFYHDLSGIFLFFLGYSVLIGLFLLFSRSRPEVTEA